MPHRIKFSYSLSSTFLLWIYSDLFLYSIRSIYLRYVISMANWIIKANHKIEYVIYILIILKHLHPNPTALLITMPEINRAASRCSLNRAFESKPRCGDAGRADWEKIYGCTICICNSSSNKVFTQDGPFRVAAVLYATILKVHLAVNR